MAFETGVPESVRVKPTVSSLRDGIGQIARAKVVAGSEAILRADAVFAAKEAAFTALKAGLNGMKPEGPGFKPALRDVVADVSTGAVIKR